MARPTKLATSMSTADLMQAIFGDDDDDDDDDDGTGERVDDKPTSEDGDASTGEGSVNAADEHLSPAPAAIPQKAENAPLVAAGRAPSVSLAQGYSMIVDMDVKDEDDFSASTPRTPETHTPPALQEACASTAPAKRLLQGAVAGGIHLGSVAAWNNILDLDDDNDSTSCTSPCNPLPPHPDPSVSSAFLPDRVDVVPAPNLPHLQEPLASAATAAAISPCAVAVAPGAAPVAISGFSPNTCLPQMLPSRPAYVEPAAPSGVAPPPSSQAAPPHVGSCGRTVSNTAVTMPPTRSMSSSVPAAVAPQFLPNPRRAFSDLLVSGVSLLDEAGLDALASPFSLTHFPNPPAPPCPPPLDWTVPQVPDSSSIPPLAPTPAVRASTNSPLHSRSSASSPPALPASFSRRRDGPHPSNLPPVSRRMAPAAPRNPTLSQPPSAPAAPPPSSSPPPVVAQPKSRTSHVSASSASCAVPIQSRTDRTGAPSPAAGNGGGSPEASSSEEADEDDDGAGVWAVLAGRRRSDGQQTRVGSGACVRDGLDKDEVRGFHAASRGAVAAAAAAPSPVHVILDPPTLDDSDSDSVSDSESQAIPTMPHPDDAPRPGSGSTLDTGQPKQRSKRRLRRRLLVEDESPLPPPEPLADHDDHPPSCSSAGASMKHTHPSSGYRVPVGKRPCRRPAVPHPTAGPPPPDLDSSGDEYATEDDTLDPRSRRAVEEEAGSAREHICMWWVNQGRTGAKNMHIVWAPVSSKHGELPQYLNLLKMRPGDIILHYFDKALRAASVVAAMARDEVLPSALFKSRVDDLGTPGWRVPVEHLTRFPNAVHFDKIRAPLMALHVGRQGPLETNGDRVRQVYSSPIPLRFFATLRTLTTVTSWPPCMSDEYLEDHVAWEAGGADWEPSITPDNWFRRIDAARPIIRPSTARNARPHQLASPHAHQSDCADSPSSTRKKRRTNKPESAAAASDGEQEEEGAEAGGEERYRGGVGVVLTAEERVQVLEVIALYQELIRRASSVDHAGASGSAPSAAHATAVPSSSRKPAWLEQYGATVVVIHGCGKNRGPTELFSAAELIAWRADAEVGARGDLGWRRGTRSIQVHKWPASVRSALTWGRIATHSYSTAPLVASLPDIPWKISDVVCNPAPGSLQLAVTRPYMPSPVLLYDLATATYRDLPGHTHGVHDVQYTADGKRLITASADLHLGVYDTASGRLLHRLGPDDARHSTPHTTPLLRLAKHPSQPRLVASLAEKDPRVLLWDIDDGNLITTYDAQGRRADPINEMQIFHSLGGDISLVGGQANGSVLMWRIEMGGNPSSRRKICQRSENGICTLAASPLSGRWLAVGAALELYLVDARTLDVCHVFPVGRFHRRELWHTSFSDCDTYLQSSWTDNQVRVWDTRQLARPVYVLDHGPPPPGAEHDTFDGVECAQWMKNQHVILSASANGLVALWDLSCGVPVKYVLSEPVVGAAVNTVDFHPTDNYFATGCHQGYVTLYTDSALFRAKGLPSPV